MIARKSYFCFIAPEKWTAFAEAARTHKKNKSVSPGGPRKAYMCKIYVPICIRNGK